MQVAGWDLYWHPAFAEPFRALVEEVGRLEARDPGSFTRHPKAKLLRRLVDLLFREIPADPGGPQFALGNTLGTTHRHWRRAKFMGRFRLFFRYSREHRIILYAWANDETSLRKVGAKTDVYSVFAARLAKGDPPSDWDDLLEAAAPATLH